MSLSRRRHRALVLAYTDQGDSGAVDSAYYVVASPDTDKQWWVDVAWPTGREVTTGMQPDHRVDVVLGFASECPIQPDYTVLLDTGTAYVVRAVLIREEGRDEVQVFAERIVEQVLAAI